MKRVLIVVIALLSLVLWGCEERTDETGGGGVILSVSDFDGLPAEVEVNLLQLAGFLSLGEITIDSHQKDPSGITSSLMNVEMDSYEVYFTRADAGTLLPPPLVQKIFGVTPINGSQIYENLRILSVDQIENRPLSDLLFVNGAFDKETGEAFTRLNLFMRFFGKTLSGDHVETAPIGFTVTFVP